MYHFFFIFEINSLFGCTGCGLNSREIAKYKYFWLLRYIRLKLNLTGFLGSRDDPRPNIFLKIVSPKLVASWPDPGHDLICLVNLQFCVQTTLDSAESLHIVQDAVRLRLPQAPKNTKA